MRVAVCVSLLGKKKPSFKLNNYKGQGIKIKDHPLLMSTSPHDRHKFGLECPTWLPPAHNLETLAKFVHCVGTACSANTMKPS